MCLCPWCVCSWAVLSGFAPQVSFVLTLVEEHWLLQVEQQRDARGDSQMHTREQIGFQRNSSEQFSQLAHTWLSAAQVDKTVA